MNANPDGNTIWIFISKPKKIKYNIFCQRKFPKCDKAFAATWVV